MALWVCTDCTCRYAVGVARCPECGSRDHVEEGQDMAKITVHGGPSNAAVEARLADGETVLSRNAAKRAGSGGEDVSAGTSSSTSSETPSQSDEPSEKQAPSRARGTGSRSTRNHEAEGSTARRTATGGRKTAGDHSDD